jgi:uncharacterized protein YyaL (SSP411 family)
MHAANPHAIPNALIGETSPYLLQHAYNPVQWFPWNPAALQKAREEQKPILVSIGYAACHWCHVMERESFENADTAALMNTHFVNIKIDREERPDLDHIYMDAVQAMTGSGGWPLNVFLTPEGKPFYGGTYFPPIRAHNRPSWTELLQSVHEAWTQRRHELDAQAENLTAHLEKANAFGSITSTGGAGSSGNAASTDAASTFFTKQALADTAASMLKNADTEWGGFGKAPKFPQTGTIAYLLRHYHFTEHKPSLDQALLSLDKMALGGINDHLGGGFARYSTDAEWLAPHFEKMAYDNALLVAVYSEAYQLTQQKFYRDIIEQTLAFVERELTSPDGGFYAALDADQEGVEGKFYTWSASEIDEILGSDAELFKAVYDVHPEGNWEHTNILWQPVSLAAYCKEQNLVQYEVEEILSRCRKKLLAHRASRVRPQLDDKILLGWNALLNKAFCKAYGATGHEPYLTRAITNMEFLWATFKNPAGGFFHTYKKEARFPAFLEDLAFLADALLHLFESTANTDWLGKAEEVAKLVIRDFSDSESPFFYYTPVGQTDVIVRKKEIYDGAVPSGNAIMAGVLHRLSLLLDRPEWGLKSQQMVKIVGNAIVRYGNSFGYWAGVLQEIVLGTNEITILGPQAPQQLKALLKHYIPHRVIMSAVRTDDSFPMLRGKTTDSLSAFWLCRQYTCLPPVSNVEELLTCIEKKDRNN